MLRSSIKRTAAVHSRPAIRLRILRWALPICLAGTALTAAAEERRMRFGEQERVYDLIGPPVHGHAKAAIIVLHGGGGSAAQVRASFGMDEVAERDGLLIAYPDGIRRHWNDGRDDFRVYGGETPPDDFAFLTELARILAGKTGDGPVFVAGISNGGMMTYRLVPLSHSTAGV